MYLRAQADILDRYLLWGLIISLFAHVALAIILNDRTPPSPPSSITVDIITPPRPAQIAPARQIVSTPDRSELAPPPADTRLLAEKDYSTPKEQIKRGDDPRAGRAAQKQSAPSPQQQKGQEQKREDKPKLQALALDRDTLLDSFALPKSSEPTRENRSTGAEGRAYQAFSRPAGSGAAFLGTAGIPDYLPNLPDGDLTLLNTKANLFAVFVRRVATQVFGQLRSTGWESLSMSDINSIGDFVTVRAVLSRKGELLRVQLEDSSGSRRFDDALQKAVSNGARDPNPPNGAEAPDGNIHFIFKARSWARIGSAARTGAPIERRWLLLGTGLD